MLVTWLEGILQGGPERFVAAAYGLTLAALAAYGVSIAREARRLRAEISASRPDRG